MSVFCSLKSDRKKARQSSKKAFLNFSSVKLYYMLYVFFRLNVPFDIVTGTVYVRFAREILLQVSR